MNQQNNSLIRQTQHNASTAYYVLCGVPHNTYSRDRIDLKI